MQNYPYTNADSETGAGNIQDEPQASYRKEVIKNSAMMGDVKGTQETTKELSIAKMEQDKGLLDSNPKYRINN